MILSLLISFLTTGAAHCGPEVLSEIKSCAVVNEKMNKGIRTIGGLQDAWSQQSPLGPEYEAAIDNFSDQAVILSSATLLQGAARAFFLTGYLTSFLGGSSRKTEEGIAASRRTKKLEFTKGKYLPEYLPLCVSHSYYCNLSVLRRASVEDSLKQTEKLLNLDKASQMALLSGREKQVCPWLQKVKSRLCHGGITLSPRVICNRNKKTASLILRGSPLGLTERRLTMRFDDDHRVVSAEHTSSKSDKGYNQGFSFKKNGQFFLARINKKTGEATPEKKLSLSDRKYLKKKGLAISRHLKQAVESAQQCLTDPRATRSAFGQPGTYHSNTTAIR